MNSRNPANHFIYANAPRPAYVSPALGGYPAERGYRVLKDKLGDPYRVYRAVHVHRPGAGYALRELLKSLKSAA